jgi:tetratricopeptide (TPR) repeat protein
MDEQWKTDLKSQDPEIRRQGIKSLVESGNPMAMGILRRIYETDPDEAVKEYAKKAGQYLFKKKEQEAKHAPATPPTMPFKAEPEPQTSAAESPGAPTEGSPRKKLSEREIESANQKLQRALTLHMRGDTKKALKQYESAITINPALKKDTFAINLASNLTGLPPVQAVDAIVKGISQDSISSQGPSAPGESPDLSGPSPTRGVQQQGQKQRHGCLTAYLVVMIIGQLFSALIYFLGGLIIPLIPTEFAAGLMPGTGAGVFILGILGLVNIACAVALLNWKQWGFWGITGTTLIALVINLILGSDISSVASSLISIAILYGVLQIGTGNKGWPQLE